MLVTSEQEVTNMQSPEDEYPDSLTIGTPGKGGSLKVYVNANNPREAVMRINNMIVLLDYANKKLEGQ